MAEQQQLLSGIDQDLVLQQRAPWGGIDILKALGVIAGIAIVLLIPSAILADWLAGTSAVDDDPQSLAVLMVANMLVEICLLLAAYRFSVQKYKLSWQSLGFRRPRTGMIWMPIVVLFASYITLGVYYGILSAVGADDLLPQSTLPDSAFDTPYVTALTMLLAVGMAPLMEETFFRGFVFGSLRSRWGLWGGAFASGLLFACLHFDVGSVVPFTIIGMIFAFSYAFSGSLFVSMAAHFAFNSISMIAAVVDAYA